ncbi:unnamed protein product [Phytomonas sp. EM1]|nr:unnamed protein product [Phytomonas sp. EM1]|eukprot:CCW65624.1 unnamed protein product [Phytomonas sp. isolate EM1]
MALPNVAHHWRPEEFRMLYRGYYREPLPARVIEGLSLPEPAGSTDAGVAAPTGEAFFNELFRCLRSTVRRHQYLALHALLLHLWCAPDGENPRVLAGSSQPDVSLKERCVHGPDCGAFVFFVLEVLSTAAHPAACQMAAACLLMLLRQEKDEFVEVLSEIGAPLSDPVENGEEEAVGRDASKNEKNKQEGGGNLSERDVDGLELPFAEISEQLRDDDDRRIGLEKMGYTNRIMAAMPMLVMEPASSSSPSRRVTGDSGGDVEETGFGLEQLWLQLLLYGDISSPRVARRVAEDPAFVSWSKLQLQRVVLGERPMASLTQHLLVWYRLMRVPAAARGLLRPSPSSSGYEPWGLYVLFACTLKPEEGLSMDAVRALTLTFMLVREMVRYGLAGEVLRDVGEALLTDGLRVGSAMVLEMWDLAAEQPPTAVGGEQGHPRMEEGYFREAALAAMELCRSTKAAPLPEREDGVHQALQTLVSATCRHYLATYFRTHPIDCFRLHGTAVETQERIQGFLSQSVLCSDLLTESFLRLSLPLPRPKQPSDVFSRVIVGCLRSHAHLPENLEEVAGQEAEGGTGGLLPAPPSCLPGFTAQREPSQHWQLALKATLTHANTRLMHAIACSFPAINKDAILGYAASMSSKYVFACLAIRSHAQYRLLPDEVCTAVEVMLLLQEFTAADDIARKGQEDKDADVASRTYHRDAHLTALFVLQSIAITKHCLDVLPRAIACLLSHGSALELDAEAHGEPLVELGKALQDGVVAAPSEGGGGLAAAGVPRPWAIAPLYDDCFAQKALWAAWLRRLLRLHQDVKNVLGWEALLTHTLLWVLPRRQELFADAAIPFNDDKAEDEGDAEGALVGLITDLAGLLLSPTPLDAGFSFAASETLGVALRAFASPEAEDGLPWPIAAALTLTATRCSPSTALAVARVLLATPLLPHSGRPLTGAGPRGIAQLRLLDGLQAWKTRRFDCRAPCWGLEEMVSLIQLLGVLLAGFEEGVEDGMTLEVFSVDDWTRLISDAERFHVWCLRALAEGIFHEFLNERQRRRSQGVNGKLLSFMEREVLRTTLEEVDWKPRVLWSHLQD